MTLPHHLVTVWNPSYAQDAMDEQVRAGTETHLYLTDYRSLYVAWVGEITAEHLPKEQPEELDHMPSYYRDQFADFWFQLWDIRRLVGDDPGGVGEGRDEVLGIGCDGILVRLGRMRMRSLQ